tara:strand:+ start:619 stop:1650 length:1032 start_codon:yes stop_codon:yes gene_type:complete
LKFNDVEPDALVLYRQIKPGVGRIIMPTVRLASGDWIQDSSNIIDHFERTECRISARPNRPVQAFASALLEVFADEWMPMAALHYRWHIDENKRFALDEFSRSGLPWLPRFVGRRLIRPMADKMRSYLPVLGVTETTIPGVEQTTHDTLAALEAQLSQTPYLLGGRPCLGDFSLFGPLWAHLYRDPGSRHLFEAYPAVCSWMQRVKAGTQTEGEFLEDDQVPEALSPLFELILEDQWAWIQTLVDHIDSYCSANPNAHRVPRALGTAPFTIRGLEGQRKLVTAVQWKAQRVRAHYDAAPALCDAWLQTLGKAMGKDMRTMPVIRNRMAYRDQVLILETEHASV